MLQAAGRNFNGRFPSQLMAPAYPKEVLRRIYDETGLTCYCPNIEIWDKELFGILCPGKEKWIGRDTWIRRTIDAVEIFGKGNVCTQVVAGAELARPHGFETVDQALKSNLEACEFFAREGVICLSTIWRPHRAARLGFQPVPPLDYYIRLAKEFHEIRRSYGLHTTDDDYRHCGNHPDSDLERLDAVGEEEHAHEPSVVCVSGGERIEAGSEIGNRAGVEAEFVTARGAETGYRLRDDSHQPLAEEAARMLADPACRKYLVLSQEKESLVSGSSHIFETVSLTSLDGRSFFLPLEEKEEHSSLGRALTGAIWFGGLAALRLDTGGESLELPVSVHRCHLAGPVFTRNYLELREKHPDVVVASVWELRQIGQRVCNR